MKTFEDIVNDYMKCSKKTLAEMLALKEIGLEDNYIEEEAYLENENDSEDNNEEKSEKTGGDMIGTSPFPQNPYQPYPFSFPPYKINTPWPYIGDLPWSWPYIGDLPWSWPYIGDAPCPSSIWYTNTTCNPNTDNRYKS